MKKISVHFLILFFLIPLLLLTSSPLYAENVIFFKGSGLDKLANLIVIPNGSMVSTMEIQIACWSPGLSNDNYYTYTPRSRKCSLYNYSSITALPELGYLDILLSKNPIVIYDTIMGAIVPIDDWRAGTPDFCPNDPEKIDPGLCGCSIADVDRDQDGIPDCNDICPDDPSNSDNDDDGTLNCIDDCPNDPAKAETGACGCGVPDILNACGTCGSAPTEVTDYIDNDCDGQIDENEESREGFWLMFLPAILNSARTSL